MLDVCAALEVALRSTTTRPRPWSIPPEEASLQALFFTLTGQELSDDRDLYSVKTSSLNSRISISDDSTVARPSSRIQNPEFSDLEQKALAGQSMTPHLQSSRWER